MANTAKKIEVAANVAIIAVALLAIAFFVTNFGMSRKPVPSPKISTGARFALGQIDWQKKNVVLALSTTCHFCTESAGFYRELVQECQKRHIRTIAVLPQAISEAQSYLSNEQVSVDEVRQGSFPDLQIGGTPTLLLVDYRGLVENVWVGKLPANKEKEVLEKIGSWAE